MAVASGSRFACEGCGKSLVWKPAQAGKRVKCSCGTIMTVPPAPMSGDKPPIPRSLKPPPQIAQTAVKPTLGYIADRPKLRAAEPLPSDKLIDTVRDIYVPTGLLVFGFIAVALWGLSGHSINAQISTADLAASCLSTIIKTTILVIACVAIAGKYGELAFGTFWTAVLKFSSIIMINDAMLIWFEAWQIHRGAIEIRHGEMYIDIWLLVWGLFMASFLIAFLLWYLFDTEKEQMFWIAAPIAFVSIAVGLGLRFALVWALQFNPAPPTPAAPPPPPPAAAAPAPPAPTTKPIIIETPHDAAITLRIEQGGLKGVYEYAGRGLGGSQRSLFKKLFDAQPARMYVETRSFLPPKLYVELPKDPGDRAACFLAHREYCEDTTTDIDPVEAKDTGQRYMVIRLQK
jgi:hypothetical protein